MAKDPAFLFYYVAFMNGTRRFNFTEKGLYITLLCEQADSETGSIPEKDTKNICLTCDKQVIKTVFEKFTKDTNGYYNEVLRNKLNERRKFCESRKNNRLGKKQVNNTSKTYVNHMENKDKDINIKELFLNVPLPKCLDTPECIERIVQYFKVRDDKGNPILSIPSIEIFFKKLKEYSDGDPKKAIKILEKSIVPGYPDIYPLKDNNNSEPKKPKPVKEKCPECKTEETREEMTLGKTQHLSCRNGHKWTKKVIPYKML